MVSVAFSCEYYRLTCFSILFFHLQMLTLLCLHQLLVHVHVDACTCIWFLKITFNLTTAAHIMAQVILAAPSQVERYTSILELLINHGLDLNAIDRSGCLPVCFTRISFDSEHVHVHVYVQSYSCTCMFWEFHVSFCLRGGFFQLNVHLNRRLPTEISIRCVFSQDFTS